MNSKLYSSIPKYTCLNLTSFFQSFILLNPTKWYYSPLLEGLVKGKKIQRKMNVQINLPSIAPPVFALGSEYGDIGRGFRSLGSCGRDYEIPPLSDNPISHHGPNQKQQREENQEVKGKSMSICCSVNNYLHKSYLSLKTEKDVWDYIKDEYARDEGTRGMQVLNLIREFEMQSMKKSETIKECSEKLLSIANRVRLLGTTFTDSRIVEKILVTMPARYEASISALENTKDLSKITLAKLL